MITKFNTLLSQVRLKLKKDPNRFLQRCSGVIHVGANTGQERDLYEKLGLQVIWVEPISEIFSALKARLVGFPKQRALQCLVTDRNNFEYKFHIANNNGESSSILDLNLHRDIWPCVSYERTIIIRSKTLASLLEQERIDVSKYDALIMDTQGSELLVLKGAATILQNFTFIKTEVPDFESYTGCCQMADIASFLSLYGYKEISRHKFAEIAGVGNYYDVVYKKKT